MLLSKFPGVYWIAGEKRLATVNLARGKNVYRENLLQSDGVEYREWNPYRSKLAAAILNGLDIFPFANGSRVLYLGAATGTTVSHVSDIVGNEGVVFAVDISYRAMKELISRVAEVRANVVPILSDAAEPSLYRHLLWSVDVLYCDVAQPNQTDIMLRNAEYYLRKGGHILMVLKASSVDSTRPAKEVCDLEARKISSKLTVLRRLELEPYALAHELVLCRT